MDLPSGTRGPKTTKLVSRDEDGFVTILCLSLVPFLLSVLVLFSAVTSARVEYSRQLHLCRTALLSAQKVMAQNLKILIQLNTKAALLRHKRKIAEAAVRLGRPVPGVNVAAETYRAKIILEQVQLTQDQLSLIRTANGLASQELAGLKTKIVSSPSGKRTQIKTGHAILAVRPDRFGLTPDYNTLPGFEKLQSIKADLVISLAESIPPWFRPLIDFKNQDWSRISATCSATIADEGNNKWRPKLGTGKFL